MKRTEELIKKLAEDPMFTQEESDDDSYDGMVQSTAVYNQQQRKSNRSPKKRARATKGSTNRLGIEVKNKLFNPSTFSQKIGLDEYSNFGSSNPSLAIGESMQLERPEKPRTQKVQWGAKSDKMEEEFVHKEPSSIEKKLLEAIETYETQNPSQGNRGGEGGVKQGEEEQEVELEIDFGFKSENDGTSNQYREVIQNTIAMDKLIKSGSQNFSVTNLGEMKQIKRLAKGRVFKSRKDLKQALINENILRRSRNFNVESMKSRFKKTSFKKVEKAQDEDSDDESYHAPAEEEEEGEDQDGRNDGGVPKTSIEEQDIVGVEESDISKNGEVGLVPNTRVASNTYPDSRVATTSTITSGKPQRLTTAQILQLECDEEELDNVKRHVDRDRGSHASMEKGSEEAESEDGVSDDEEDKPKRRLMRNGEFREKKKAERRKNKAKYLIEIAKKNKALKKRVGGLVEEEAELGEIDRQGNEIKLNINKNSDEEKDDEDEDNEDIFANIEGLIDDFDDFEGEEENVRDEYLRSLMVRDSNLIKKIINGNYLTKRNIAYKLEKDDKLKSRVSKNIHSHLQHSYLHQYYPISNQVVV